MDMPYAATRDQLAVLQARWTTFNKPCTHYRLRPEWRGTKPGQPDLRIDWKEL
jgi:hypothetical protein